MVYPMIIVSKVVVHTKRALRFYSYCEEQRKTDTVVPSHGMDLLKTCIADTKMYVH